MWLRTSVLTVIILASIGNAGDCRKCVGQAAASARSFRDYFSGLRAAEINPIERLVFSFMLANASQENNQGDAAKAGAARNGS